MFSKILNIITLCVFCHIVFANPLYATTYNVGPNQQFKELDEIDWLSLKGGDTVLIFGRDIPYRTKIGLHTMASEDQPLTIKGVRGRNGKFPVISGQNATTPKSLNGFFNAKWDEANALIFIKRSSQMKWGEKPQNIIIEGIEFRDALIGNSFTDQFGNKREYSKSSSAIWANLIENLTIQNCLFVNNGNAIFVLSKDSEADLSRNILIKNNTFSDNGVANSYFQHNIYTQASGVRIEGNLIKPLKQLSQGAAIKDRSAGTVIKNNKIYAGTYAIDLVDPEDSYSLMLNEPDFDKTYVVGNVIISKSRSDDRPFASRLIHYGGDTTVYNIYRKGTLFFLYNTLYLDINQSDNQRKSRWRTALFIMDTNEEKVFAANNIIYSKGDTTLSWLSKFGQLEIAGGNWLKHPITEGADNQVFAGAVEKTGKLHYGTYIGFENEQYNDFRLTSDSPARYKAQALPVVFELEGTLLNEQLNTKSRLMPRESLFDLGAYEYIQAPPRAQHSTDLDQQQQLMTSRKLIPRANLLDLGAYEHTAR
ncbi:right-handed parallel beta-helix repeat-containing protein [Thalassotalea sp. LPB0316]|uniref:right-handed parallel beta-helix repeat-containing protein n=1 Tax=Thalassotalea sp. LPB0316 TaxID=2769490 RepID=UPI0018681EC7|nr:right-handed parallel beta-helix repeat-containing protein [Thalassotalea sp. LPB0316]QOL26504.1 right-handed parallel beta-helix repeat-containing protein [Thalassotalea sp. LPB0316]